MVCGYFFVFIHFLSNKTKYILYMKVNNKKKSDLTLLWDDFGVIVKA